MLAGVDGYRRGWIAAVDRGRRRTEIRTYADFRALVHDASLTVIVIDVPIGLMERGVRQCDLAARRVLGPRRSSIFPAPIRAVLAARSYAEACRIGFEREGKKCSRQLWGIVPKIREVDRLMTVALQRRVREGHPELCFAMMNAGRPLAVRKADPKGRDARRLLLAGHFPDVADHLLDVPSATTDILDAYACLWTARRLVCRRAITLPAQPEADRRGLRMEIVV